MRSEEVASVTIVPVVAAPQSVVQSCDIMPELTTDAVAVTLAPESAQPV